jgi:hypothetical protein
MSRSRDQEPSPDTLPHLSDLRRIVTLLAPLLASELDHESSTTTIQCYIKPEAVSGAQQRPVMTVLDGTRPTP